MSARMTKVDRLLKLVHLLADESDGLTLDDMADRLGVNRRTAERLRDLVSVHFDLDDRIEDRRKYYRIQGSLRREYTRPTAAEIAALQAIFEAEAEKGAPQAALLGSLLAKVKGAMDDRERRRMDADLSPLARLQRVRVPPGPMVEVDPRALAAIQHAILALRCVEFDYFAADAEEPAWRRVVPYGLIHGPVTYLIAQFPGREDGDPVTFRLDRMTDPRVSDVSGAPPEEWDLDAWHAQSFGIWREDDYEIVLRVLPGAVQRARTWRFHPRQEVEEDGDCLIVRFRVGGLWEIADHVFTWGGDVVIEKPEELREVMMNRIEKLTL